MSRDGATLLDILDAARAALEFLGDLDEDTFRKDRKTQSAVLHQHQVVGSAHPTTVTASCRPATRTSGIRSCRLCSGGIPIQSR